MENGVTDMLGDTVEFFGMHVALSVSNSIHKNMIIFTPTVVEALEYLLDLGVESYQQCD